MVLADSGKVHRTTINLRPEDEANVQALNNLMGVNNTQSIRRALSVLRELLEWTNNGGEVVLEKGRDKQVLRFY